MIKYYRPQFWLLVLEILYLMQIILVKLFMKISALLIIALLQTNVEGQIANPDFELWPNEIDSLEIFSPILDTVVQSKPIGWQTNYPWSDLGFLRTTDAISNRYAIVLHSWYSYQNSQIFQKGKLDQKPTSLNGDYKFRLEYVFPDTTDVALALVEIYDTSQNIIGEGKILLDTVSSYQSFRIEIDYISDVEADSFFVSFKNTENGCSPLNNECKFLF